MYITAAALVWSLLNCFRTERGHCVPAEGNGYLQTLICVLVARHRRCLTLSNPVPWQNWMAAYLDYTLWMKTPFRGWPVMVHDTHTRKRLWFCRNDKEHKKVIKCALKPVKLQPDSYWLNNWLGSASCLWHLHFEFKCTDTNNELSGLDVVTVICFYEPLVQLSLNSVLKTHLLLFSCLSLSIV